MDCDKMSNNIKSVPVINENNFNTRRTIFPIYLVIGLTIIIIFIREAIGGVPSLDFMRVIKYPVALLTILLLCQSIRFFLTS